MQEHSEAVYGAKVSSVGGVDGTAKGNIVLANEVVVPGVLYQPGIEQVQTLAQYEGGYIATQLAVYAHQHAKVYSCTTYKVINTTSGLRPRHAYLKHYETGLREHGLPPEYRAYILGEDFLAGVSDDLQRWESPVQP